MHNRANNKNYSLLLGCALLLIPSITFAATGRDLSDILKNLRALLHPMILLVLTVSFISGIALIFRGFTMLKQFGMPLTQMSRPGELGGPLVYIVVGAVLIYLPTTTSVVSETIFQGTASIFQGGQLNLAAAGKASSTLLGYAPVAIEDQWADLADTLVLYIQFIGFIAFVRGWFIISKAGQPGVQPGSISRGLIHIIGGILAVNFLPLAEAVRNTLFQ